jgi:hypothetical protein
MNFLSIISLALIVTSTYGVIRRQGGEKENQRSSPAANTTNQESSSKIRFTPAGSMDGLTADGFEFSAEGFTSSDGGGATVTRQYCRTAENADKALAQRIKDVKIIEQSDVLDEVGKQTGRRVVTVFAGPKELEGKSAILWTEGSTLFVIESDAMKYALLLEEQFFHKKTRASQ